LIRTLNDVVSTHAAEELEDDKLSILDLENVILSGQRGKLRNVSATLKPAKAEPSPSQPMSPDNLCAHCGGSSVQVKHVTRSFGKASALLVIEDIPMFSCPDCGESYFSAQTLHEIERIKALRKSVAVARPVPVASFQLAAA
jgi:YgiT-type zinc finger domain-containing protein